MMSDASPTLTPLAFRKNGSFTIIQFTDLHFGGAHDAFTAALMRELLALEKPDLAVLTGDIIASIGHAAPADLLRNALQPCADAGVPFALTLGNHDDEGPLDRKGLWEIAQGLPGCVNAPLAAFTEGVGDQSLVVKGRNGGMSALLHLLDSHAYAPGGGSYAWLKPNQAAWHRQICTSVENARPDWQRHLPELAFFHIPLPEHRQAWDNGKALGHRGEEVCCPLYNSGFFEVLRAAGHVLGAFVGHDHLNDYLGQVDGVALGFGRATGHSGYGKEGFARGARMIRLRENVRDLETWIRLEGGGREQILGSIADLERTLTLTRL
jgi:hypothetical protein